MIALVCTLALSAGCLIMLGIRTPRPPRVRRQGAPMQILVTIGVALLGGSLALVVTAVPVVAVLASLTSGCVPAWIQRRRRRFERRQRLASWPTLLDDITSAVRAGMNLPEAIARAGERSQLSHEFAAFESAYRRSGDFTGSVLDLRTRIDEPVFDQLAQALVVTREVGGTDLTGVLRSLGIFIRDEIHLRGELEARQSWTVNSARMAVAAPWIVLVLLSSRPATIAAYSDLTGALVLVAVAACSALAYALMVRIAKLGEVGA